MMDLCDTIARSYSTREPTIDARRQKRPRKHRDVESEFTPRENIFINYLPNHWTKRELIAICSEYGDIESARVILNLQTGESSCYGFVRFRRLESAVRALSGLNGRQVCNKRLLVRYADTAKENSGSQSDTILVRSIPPLWTKSMLWDAFKNFGTICSFGTKSDERTGRFTAITLQYDNIRSADLALRTMNNLALEPESWPLHIVFTNERPEQLPGQVINGIRVERPHVRDRIVLTDDDF